MLKKQTIISLSQKANFKKISLRNPACLNFPLDTVELNMSKINDFVPWDKMIFYEVLKQWVYIVKEAPDKREK